MCAIGVLLIIKELKDDFALNFKDRQRWKLWAAVRRLKKSEKSTCVSQEKQTLTIKVPRSLFKSTKLPSII